MSLEQFTQAYIECALWADEPDNEQERGAPWTADQIAPESLELARAECMVFWRRNSYMWGAANGYDDSRGGHDFWLSRNGHGAGYFDRDELTEYARDRLQDRAKSFGEANIYRGDDGLIYCE